MAQASVFYSWQSDLDNSTNRSFIEDCLQKAIKQLRATGGLYLDPCLDRDTQGASGSPDIAATIFDKIDVAEVFVCDVSIIQRDVRPSPNPNVLLELGYAVKRLGWDRIICILNEHFGGPDELPFDLRQRRVRAYRLPPGTEDKASIRNSLTSTLRDELAQILSSKADLGENMRLGFADIAARTPLGDMLDLEKVFVPCDPKRIPDYQSDRSSPGIYLNDDNPDYLREVAEYIHLSLLLHPIGFVLYNGNSAVLNDVKMELELPKTNGLIVRKESPDKPSQSRSSSMLRGIKPVWDRFEKPGDVNVTELEDRYLIGVKFGKIHAEASAWSQSFFFGASKSCDVPVSMRIYADELNSPTDRSLTIRLSITEKEMRDLEQDTVVRLLRQCEE